jgi:glycosyltransferase involved in cell wall biosynthesis
MSCGKVVVATREQDIPLIVEHGFNGLLVDDLNPEDLADALRLAASSERAAFIAANARETIVNSFSREVGRERLLQMYTSILNR